MEDSKSRKELKIIVEGSANVGKSTIVALIAQMLEDKGVVGVEIRGVDCTPELLHAKSTLSVVSHVISEINRNNVPVVLEERYGRVVPRADFGELKMARRVGLRDDHWVIFAMRMGIIAANNQWQVYPRRLFELDDAGNLFYPLTVLALDAFKTYLAADKPTNIQNEAEARQHFHAYLQHHDTKLATSPAAALHEIVPEYSLKFQMWLLALELQKEKPINAKPPAEGDLIVTRDEDNETIVGRVTTAPERTVSFTTPKTES